MVITSKKGVSVTIFSDYYKNERIIALGAHYRRPNNNYYKLDISWITELGDTIGICWDETGEHWQIVSHKSVIIESEIDTTKYKVLTSWYLDDGIPNTKYYQRTNCMTVDMLAYTTEYPEGNMDLERN